MSVTIGKLVKTKIKHIAKYFINLLINLLWSTIWEKYSEIAFPTVMDAHCIYNIESEPQAT